MEKNSRLSIWIYRDVEPLPYALAACDHRFAVWTEVLPRGGGCIRDAVRRPSSAATSDPGRRRRRLVAAAAGGA